MRHVTFSDYLESQLDEITERELYEWYDEALGCEGPVSVAGYEYEVSDVLKQIDPTAYRCGFSDWLDGELGYSIEEYEGRYYDYQEFHQRRDEWEYREEVSDEY